MNLSISGFEARALSVRIVDEVKDIYPTIDEVTLRHLDIVNGTIGIIADNIFESEMLSIENNTREYTISRLSKEDKEALQTLRCIKWYIPECKWTVKTKRMILAFSNKNLFN